MPGSKPCKRAYSAGFSLLELLVVILVIGLAVSLVSFTGSGDNSAYKLREELRFFANTVSLIAEEAALSGQQRGVDFYWDLVDGQEVYGYRWLKLEEDEWQPYAPVDFDEENFFSPGHDLLVEMDGSELEINEKLIPDESSALDAEKLEPDIWLFSSGEVTPFTLSLTNREAPEQYQTIDVDMLGRISLETAEQ